jgi:predicted SprT family Zn-dependent metalloprotease
MRRWPRVMPDRFSKAVIEYVGRGRYLYSCDVCSKTTTEVVSLFHGPHGEKVDLCGDCLNDKRPSRQRRMKP